MMAYTLLKMVMPFLCDPCYPQEGYDKRGDTMAKIYPSSSAPIVCRGDGIEIVHHKLKFPWKDTLCCKIGGDSTRPLFT